MALDTLDPTTEALTDDQAETPDPTIKPEAPLYGDPTPPRGPLLDKPEADAAKLATELFFSQKQYIRQKILQGRVNALRRKGIPNVGLVKKADDDVGWDIYIPPNVTADSLPALNKAAATCRRLASLMFADPPACDPVPATGEDEDADAADMTARILEDLDGENALNHPGTWRRAFDRASSWASSYVHYYVHPRRGGYLPIEVMAGPEAQTIDDAEGPVQHEPVLDPITQQPVIDPATGQPAMQPIIGPDGEPVRGQWPEYVLRYVTADGTLTDAKAKAACRWVPGLCKEILDCKTVRHIPHDAEDIWECDGLQIGFFRTWGELKALYPKVAELDATPEGQAIREKLFKYQPEDEKNLMGPGDRRRKKVDAKNKDEQLVFGIITYYVAGPEYPEGCFCATLGDSLVAHRQEWMDTAEDGGREKLDIPVTQFKQFGEGEDDPVGVALMELIGPGNEMMLALWSTMVQHMEQFGRRKTFVPMQSNLTDSQINGSTNRIVRILPGGQPFFEQLPDLPSFIAEMWPLVQQAMDDTSGINDTAKGLNDPNVESGRHAYLLMAQVHAGLSELKQNVERAVVRSWRIVLQLVRAYYSVPRKLRWQGEDGDFKEESWMGADLSSGVDVRIKAGTMTMLSPASKAMMAEHFAALQLYDDPAEFRDVITSSVGGVVGMQDDPARLRIKRQIARWKDGPPEGWTPPQADPMAVDPMTGQPLPPPLSPEEQALWEPTPADTMPHVARTRLYELSRLMQSKRYLSKPPEWRRGMDAEFARMVQAASPPPPPAPAAGGAPAPAQPNALGVPGVTAGAENPANLGGGMAA